jgi:glutamate-1-semialdehyde 2,1-aminomutase
MSRRGRIAEVIVRSPLVTGMSRLRLSQAKDRSLAGHPRISRWISRQVPFYEYEDEAFFASDGAPPDIVERRRAGFMRLTELYRQRFAQSAKLASEVNHRIADLQFTAAHRVPFQYSRFVARHLDSSVFVRASSGVRLEDIDGNSAYDVGGSYGVNLFGYDFYKQCIDAASERVRDLGPVLGPYHPLIADNVERLARISGLDQISFHMSGTEAVMQAVRLARYHTGRSHVVRFSGSYHGFWDDVQPGIGNPLPARTTYTLKEMDDATLRVLRERDDIACVLVNPLQALHPNKNAPSDGSLLGRRSAHFDREAYRAWLVQLREVCTERGIPLVFDEVFVGFRLAPGGAQEYFGVRADIVTYGKTLGGGFPVGVICGRADLMKRFRDDRPMDICFARGTFNSHPYVIAAMQQLLHRLETPAVQQLYLGLDALWNRRAGELNRRLANEGVPVRVENLSTIWTVCYSEAARYNWMLQYYLRAEGLSLSWVGTGRLIFSLNYEEPDFDAVAARFVAAARAMQADGFFWRDERKSDGALQRRLLREVIAQRL